MPIPLYFPRPKLENSCFVNWYSPSGIPEVSFSILAACMHKTNKQKFLGLCNVRLFQSIHNSQNNTCNNPLCIEKKTLENPSMVLNQILQFKRFLDQLCQLPQIVSSLAMPRQKQFVSNSSTPILRQQMLTSII